MTADLDFFPSLPASWQRLPLKAVCDYRVSNVDKVPADDELPVRLCNYTDVYKNEFIRLDMDLMQTTATAAEIARFGLAVGDVAITKDSETWDDIGVPAYIAESSRPSLRLSPRDAARPSFAARWPLSFSMPASPPHAVSV